jgi:hypothetical protein
MGTIIRIIIIILTIFPVSCHLFYRVDDTQNVAVYFNETNVSVYEDGLGSLSLRIEPPDGLPYQVVDYQILNEEIAVVFRADRRGVVFLGKREGSTLITAMIGKAEAKAVINVYKQ